MSAGPFTPPSAPAVPTGWRGNCHCGRWLVVLESRTRAAPLRCACGRAWFIEGDAVCRVDPPGLTAGRLFANLIRLAGALARRGGVAAGRTLERVSGRISGCGCDGATAPVCSKCLGGAPCACHQIGER